MVAILQSFAVLMGLLSLAFIHGQARIKTLKTKDASHLTELTGQTGNLEGLTTMPSN